MSAGIRSWHDRVVCSVKDDHRCEATLRAIEQMEDRTRLESSVWRLVEEEPNISQGWIPRVAWRRIEAADEAPSMLVVIREPGRNGQLQSRRQPSADALFGPRDPGTVLSGHGWDRSTNA